MNKHAGYLTFFLLLTTAGIVKSQETYRPMADPAEFRSSLENMSGSIRTIACEFIQEKNLVVLSEKIISKGEFYFMKDNNIRWEYKSPYRYLIIIANGRLFTHDDKNRKLYDIESNAMFSEMNRFISGCIQGNILRNEKDYTAEYLENNKHYLVKLIPRSEKMRQMLAEVQICFDRNDFTVTSLRMEESGADYTKIDFINKKLNSDIPLEKFDFK